VRILDIRASFGSRICPFGDGTRDLGATHWRKTEYAAGLGHRKEPAGGDE
jgi:hypothetical protein